MRVKGKDGQRENEMGKQEKGVENCVIFDDKKKGTVQKKKQERETEMEGKIEDEMVKEKGKSEKNDEIGGEKEKEMMVEEESDEGTVSEEGLDI